MAAPVTTSSGLASVGPGASAASGLAIGAAVLASAFGSDDGPVFCAFRRCTGGYCPGCGASRAVAALFRGELATSWAIHPLVPLLALQAAVFGALFVVGRRDRLRRWLVPILVANLVFGLVVWSVRLRAGVIPIPFG